MGEILSPYSWIQKSAHWVATVLGSTDDKFWGLVIEIKSDFTWWHILQVLLQPQLTVVCVNNLKNTDFMCHWGIVVLISHIWVFILQIETFLCDNKLKNCYIYCNRTTVFVTVNRVFFPSRFLQALRNMNHFLRAGTEGAECTWKNKIFLQSWWIAACVVIKKKINRYDLQKL